MAERLASILAALCVFGIWMLLVWAVVQLFKRDLRRMK